MPTQFTNLMPLLVVGNDFISDSIEHVEQDEGGLTLPDGSRPSHVAWVLNGCRVCEMTWPKFVITPLSDWLKAQQHPVWTARLKVPLSQRQVAAAWQWSLRREGSAYDVPEIVGFLGTAWFRRFMFWAFRVTMQPPATLAGNGVCSVNFAWLLQYLGFKLPLPATAMEPDEIIGLDFFGPWERVEV
jgi:hypothetical protein